MDEAWGKPLVPKETELGGDLESAKRYLKRSRDGTDIPFKKKSPEDRERTIFSHCSEKVSDFCTMYCNNEGRFEQTPIPKEKASFCHDYFMRAAKAKG